jgi:hypothetical protein
LSAIAGCAAAIVITLWFLSRNLPAPGDISAALAQHPGAYRLSLGHMGDLTLRSFAYLRLPLILAGAAFAAGAIGMLRANGRKAFLAAGLMMVVFFHAARLALVAFDPYLSSRPLADALLRAPEGKLIVDHHYYTFSSVFFYTGRPALLLNGRFQNLVYGSYAPNAPDVFIDDARWRTMWLTPGRCYLVITDAAAKRLEKLAGKARLHTVAESGGKKLLTNQPL